MNDAKRAGLVGRYMAAMHGMQSGVALDEARGAKDLNPKHLRVGVNSSLMQNSALANLLVSKGIILEEEWLTALADAAERERDSYEEKLSTETSKVTLR